jgi:hypothetical protein
MSALARVLVSSRSAVRRVAAGLLIVSLLEAPGARAWGELGHEVTALIAYHHLTASARTALDALLASDDDTLTKADFASRANWADKYRSGHRETAAWHFIDIEIDHPDMSTACFGFPALAAGQPASQGPAQDCIVNKIEQFSAELQNRSTQPAERLLALKFLIHFIGDLHQPLHAADHEDRGGNCVALSPSPGEDKNLHAYWDVGAVAALGRSAPEIAARLNADITSEDLKSWTRGDARTWALESFELARKDAYAIAARPTCGSHGSTYLSAEYQSQAQRDAAVQIEKAAIRMAALLDKALGTS